MYIMLSRDYYLLNTVSPWEYPVISRSTITWCCKAEADILDGKDGKKTWNVEFPGAGLYWDAHAPQAAMYQTSTRKMLVLRGNQATQYLLMANGKCLTNTDVESLLRLERRTRIY